MSGSVGGGWVAEEVDEEKAEIVKLSRSKREKEVAGRTALSGVCDEFVPMDACFKRMTSGGPRPETTESRHLGQ